MRRHSPHPQLRDMGTQEADWRLLQQQGDGLPPYLPQSCRELGIEHSSTLGLRQKPQLKTAAGLSQSDRKEKQLHDQDPTPTLPQQSSAPPPRPLPES